MRTEAACTFQALPHDPSPIEFASLGLDPRLAAGLADRGFVRTTPIQAAVFGAITAGTNLVGCAETGTGKTIAYLLPILQRLLVARATRTVGPKAATRGLVLVPTRELAVQIEDDFQGLAYHAALSGAAVYGGVDPGYQLRALRGGVDLVVATPGRLLDHLSSGAADFTGLEVLILDEADRMMDMGFWPSVRRIVAALPARRQTLLFSATMGDAVMRSAAQIMDDPRVIQVGPARRPARTIKHVSHVVPSGEKVRWLTGFLRRTQGSTLVFVRTKHGADRLASRLLAGGIRCAPLHADRTQSQRTAAVVGFRGGQYTVLVATDLAARGLDIEGIGHVVNYEVPPTAEAYVHRVGRTGRAEATGTAVTLIAPEEMPALRALERSLQMSFAGGPTRPEPPAAISVGRDGRVRAPGAEPM